MCKIMDRVRGNVCKTLFTLMFFVLLFCFITELKETEAATLNYSKKHLLVGESFQLTVNTSREVTYTSSNKKVCKVSKRGKVTALRAGRANIKVKVGKKTYTCKVTVSNYVDLILFVGQSNMTGQGGNQLLAPGLKDGAGYECKTQTTEPELLPLTEPFGLGEDSVLLNDQGYHNGTLVTAFVNSYYSETKVPVVAVAATRGGSNSGQWAGSFGDEAIQRYKIAYQYLKEHKIKVRKSFLVYYQGESEAIYASDILTPEFYINNVRLFVTKAINQTKIQECFLIPIGNNLRKTVEYDAIRIAQERLCESEYAITMITEKTPFLTSRYYLSDGIHINQIGLNLIGKDAGTNAGKLAGTFAANYK